MTIEITGKNYVVSERIRGLIEKRVAKIKRYFKDIIEIRCVLKKQKHTNSCEMYVVGKDYDVKSVQKSDTMEEAITSAIDALKRQADKNHAKMTDHRRKKTTGPKLTSPEQWLVQVLEPGKLRRPRKKVPRIVKTSSLLIRPMSIEEAAIQLDDSKNEFVVFRDLDTEKVTVLYRRRDNNFGMIATEV